MHAIMLADLASTIALHGPSLLSRSEAIPSASLQQYWVASRSRASRWHDLLAEHRTCEHKGNMAGARSWWERNHHVLEEILVSDVLTRVYGAIGAALDSQVHEPEVSPVVHSVYLSHLETRNRVLSMMIRGQGAPVSRIAALNKLRKGVERWSDVLIGQIAALHPEASRYGIELERVVAFAEDAVQYSSNQRQTAGWLLSASMRDSLYRQTSNHPACPSENESVCDSVLMCLRPDMFDSFGMLQSLWIHRLIYGTMQTDEVLEQLINPQENSAGILDGYEAVRSPMFSRRDR